MHNLPVVGKLIFIPREFVSELFLIIIWLLALFDSGFVLHLTEGVAEVVGELLVGHRADLLGLEGLAETDGDRTGREKLLVSGPDLESAVDQNGHDRRLRAPAEQAEARFDRDDPPIVRPRALGVQAHAGALPEPVDNHSHGRDVRLVPTDGNGVHRGDQRTEEPVTKERVTGDVGQVPIDGDPAKDRVQVALVVAGENHGAGLRDVLPAAHAIAKHERAKHLAHEPRQPIPGRHERVQSLRRGN